MNTSDIAALLPTTVGYEDTEPCLCIGLDIAWFGGSKGSPDTQNDCLVSAVVNAKAGKTNVHMHPVKLKERDPEAKQIFEAIQSVVKQHGTVQRVVLAIDAPLQGSRAIPLGRTKARRACEDRLNAGRKAIDQAQGRANGWHPNIQPGLPLAPRVQNLLLRLTQELGMQPWTEATGQHDRLIIECFPSEAIWAAKRLGGYQKDQLGAAVKSYKKQQGKMLSAHEVEQIVSRVLLGAFEDPSSMPNEWPRMVEDLIAHMLKRPCWQTKDGYRGGKLLDDVIDSAICFAVALSYAHGKAHIWHDPNNQMDGHIIGPGTMQGLPPS